MRYYSIRITNPTTGRVVVPNSLAGLGITDTTYTSFANGRTLPGALNVEIDATVAPFASPSGGAFLRVSGISLAEISQSSDINGFLIEVFGGFQKGLPLANPLQAGLLFSGFIFQAFGNWVGTQMDLDMIVNTGTGTIADPVNLIHNWSKGTVLTDAIQQTISTGFPQYSTDIEISPDLVYVEDDVGYYQTMEQYAAYLKSRSKAIIGGNYNGVEIFLTDNTFSVYDGTVQSIPRQINFNDMIGQPTWIAPGIIQLKCAMRADIAVGDFIKMPQGIVTTTAAATSSQLDLRSAFLGTFLVQQVRHNGNFRQPDASSWVTVIDASAQSIKNG